jgi:hypothetical protein
MRSVGLQADVYGSVGRLRVETSAWTPTLRSGRGASPTPAWVVTSCVTPKPG